MKRSVLLLGLVVGFLVSCEKTEITESNDEINVYSTDQGHVGDPGDQTDEER